ncbi:hypothetical protein AX761_22660 [Rhizobium sp. 58]|nr:hypothetical protein AX761_22660 [Rhizobium sp. 58]
MRRIMKEATRLGARLFRQQVGMGWIGKAFRIERKKMISVNPGDVVVKSARPFHTGFPGWSDTGGWTPVVVTPEMVGTTIAVYTAVEVKDKTSLSTEQRAFLLAVKNAGGIAGVAKSEDDLSRILFG